jgi:hypothetical protein
VEPLRARIERAFAPEAHAMLGAGLQRVLEYQDLAYGTEYLDRLPTCTPMRCVGVALPTATPPPLRRRAGWLWPWPTTM